MFSGFKLYTYNTFAIHEPPCLILQCFHSRCQGLSNLRGLLAVRLNELEKSLTDLQQQNITYSTK